MKYIGLDIAKSTFVAAYHASLGFQVQSFPNDVRGIKQFISTLNVQEHHCVMEATGTYGMLLLYLLSDGGFRVSMINPKQIKHFARMMMSVTKTDAVDAKLIALYGDKMTPSSFKMPSKAIIILKQKKVVIRQLKKQLTAIGNVEESFSAIPFVDQDSLSTIKKTRSFLERQIRELEQTLSELSTQEFSKQLSLLTSIKGIGITLATSLIVATSGFTQFDNAKQLSRYIGICPTVQQSGTSINVRGHINRNGDSALRSQLYIATWSAIRYNSACKECYQRLKANGKPSKVALIAVANKLVRQAFAVCKFQMPYLDGFCSAE